MKDGEGERQGMTKKYHVSVNYILAICQCVLQNQMSTQGAEQQFYEVCLPECLVPRVKHSPNGGSMKTENQSSRFRSLASN